MVLCPAPAQILAVLSYLDSLHRSLVVAVSPGSPVTCLMAAFLGMGGEGKTTGGGGVEL